MVTDSLAFRDVRLGEPGGQAQGAEPGGETGQTGDVPLVSRRHHHRSTVGRPRVGGTLVRRLGSAASARGRCAGVPPPDRPKRRLVGNCGQDRRDPALHVHTLRPACAAVLVAATLPAYRGTAAKARPRGGGTDTTGTTGGPARTAPDPPPAARRSASGGSPTPTPPPPGRSRGPPSRSRPRGPTAAADGLRRRGGRAHAPRPRRPPRVHPQARLRHGDHQPSGERGPGRPGVVRRDDG